MLSKNFKKLVYEIKVLNPDAEIRIGNPKFDELAEFRIFSSVNVKELKLPVNCYVDRTNSIQNNIINKKQKILVFPIHKMDPGKTLPDLSGKKIEEFLSKENTVCFLDEIASMLQRLNPDVKIETDNANIYYEGITKREDLVLPGCIKFIQNSDQLYYTCKNQKPQKFYILSTIRNKEYYLGHEVYNLSYDKASQYMVDKMKADYEKLNNLKETIAGSISLAASFEFVIALFYYNEIFKESFAEYIKEIISRCGGWDNLIEHLNRIGIDGTLILLLELVSAGVAIVSLPKYISERINFKYNYGERLPKNTQELQKLSRTLNQPRKK